MYRSEKKTTQKQQPKKHLLMLFTTDVFFHYVFFSQQIFVNGTMFVDFLPFMFMLCKACIKNDYITKHIVDTGNGQAKPRV